MYNICRVETFIEVRIVYHNGYTQVQYTNIAEGDYPEWNEVLSFPLEPLNGKHFTQSELEQSKTMIYISIFDQEISHDEDFSQELKLKVE